MAGTSSLDLTQSSQPPPRGRFWGLRLGDMPREHLAPNAVSTSPSNETRAGQSAALVVDVVGRWTGAVGTWLVFKIRTLYLPLKSGAAADRPSSLVHAARSDGRT